MSRSLIVGLLVLVGLIGLIVTGLYAAFLHSTLLGTMLVFGVLLAVGIVAGFAWGINE